jgi:hypothetical protein
MAIRDKCERIDVGSATGFILGMLQAEMELVVAGNNGDQSPLFRVIFSNQF